MEQRVRVTVKGDRFHSYMPAFMILEIMPVVSCLIFLWLGPHPFPEQGQAVSGAAEKTPAWLSLIPQRAGERNSTRMGNGRS